MSLEEHTKKGSLEQNLKEQQKTAAELKKLEKELLELRVLEVEKVIRDRKAELLAQKAEMLKNQNKMETPKPIEHPNFIRSRKEAEEKKDEFLLGKIHTQQESVEDVVKKIVPGTILEYADKKYLITKIKKGFTGANNYYYDLLDSNGNVVKNSTNSLLEVNLKTRLREGWKITDEKIKETSETENTTPKEIYILCPNCGTHLPAYAKFCGRCAKEIKPIEEDPSYIKDPKNEVKTKPQEKPISISKPKDEPGFVFKQMQHPGMRITYSVGEKKNAIYEVYKGRDLYTFVDESDESNFKVLTEDQLVKAIESGQIGLVGLKAPEKIENKAENLSVVEQVKAAREEAMRKEEAKKAEGLKIKCENCTAPLTPEALFCEHCGTKTKFAEILEKVYAVGMPGKRVPVLDEKPRKGKPGAEEKNNRVYAGSRQRDFERINTVEHVKENSIILYKGEHYEVTQLPSAKNKGRYRIEHPNGKLIYKPTKEELEKMFNSGEAILTLEGVQKQENKGRKVKEKVVSKEVKFCSNCGAEIRPGTSFCYLCGMNLITKNLPRDTSRLTPIERQDIPTEIHDEKKLPIKEAKIVDLEEKPKMTIEEAEEILKTAESEEKKKATEERKRRIAELINKKKSK